MTVYIMRFRVRILFLYVCMYAHTRVMYIHICMAPPLVDIHFRKAICICQLRGGVLRLVIYNDTVKLIVVLY
jgi:hypothetical protein